MFSIEKFKNQYNVEIQNLIIGGRKISYFFPRSIEPFIDDQNPMNHFPLWAKIWPSAMVLADFMATQAVDKKRQILEIGAGLGIVGIAASLFGHQISISEYDTHAIDFINANAFLNGCAGINVMALDWANPGVGCRYDQIIGSDVVFRENDFSPIQKLFKSVLKPSGEVVLASEIRKPVIGFFQIMENSYHLNARQKVLRCEDEELKIILCHMKPKNYGSQLNSTEV